jgi:hypothetical protein
MGECIVYVHESDEDCPCSPIPCQAVDNLTSEKIANHAIRLTWSEPEGDLPVDGYRIFRNDVMMVEELISGTSYLDENLPDGDYEYYVVACCANGCISDSSNHVVERVGVGVKEIEEIEGITLHPNPTTGNLVINHEKLEINGVDFFDVTGRNVGSPITVSHFGNTMEWDISHLKTGVYFVQIKTGKGVVSTKIIKY